MRLLIGIGVNNEAIPTISAYEDVSTLQNATVIIIGLVVDLILRSGAQHTANKQNLAFAKESLAKNKRQFEINRDYNEKLKRIRAAAKANGFNLLSVLGMAQDSASASIQPSSPFIQASDTNAFSALGNVATTFYNLANWYNNWVSDRGLRRTMGKFYRTKYPNLSKKFFPPPPLINA